MPTEVAGEAELGYRLRPEFWGRGLATEIGAALIDHGFSTVGLRTILAQTMAVNSGSRAVMAKLGMRHIRTFTWEGPEQPIPGIEHGEVEYRLDRDAATGRPAPTMTRGRSAPGSDLCAILQSTVRPIDRMGSYGRMSR